MYIYICKYTHIIITLNFIRYVIIFHYISLYVFLFLICKSCSIILFVYRIILYYIVLIKVKINCYIALDYIMTLSSP